MAQRFSLPARRCSAAVPHKLGWNPVEIPALLFFRSPGIQRFSNHEEARHSNLYPNDESDEPFQPVGDACEHRRSAIWRVLRQLSATNPPRLRFPELKTLLFQMYT